MRQRLLGNILIGLFVVTWASASPATATFEQIVYTSSQDIYAMSPDGSNRVNLTNTDRAAESSPAIWRFGGRIAYARSEFDNGERRIFVMNADGTGQRPLTGDMGVAPGSIAWSPDGTKIIFSVVVPLNAPPSERDEEIFIMNADGSGLTQLTNNDHSDISPSFSPDQSKILFSSNRDGNLELYLMNIDGSGQARLTFREEYSDYHGVFDPSGSKITFVSTRNGDIEFKSMNVDGTGLVTLLDRQPRLAGGPQYSPDGSHITFFFDAGDLDIFTMKADGTDVTNLTIGPVGHETTPSWGLAFNSDSDDIPDFADPDDDNDGILDGADNCKTIANTGQADADADGLGNACDADDDNDGTEDEEDDLPTDPTETSDNDSDGIGDNADADDDNDSVSDGSDNCPLTPNSDQADFDLDGIGDTCDPQTGPPTNKNQCKKNGWARFNFPRIFRNQGDCVSFLMSGN